MVVRSGGSSSSVRTLPPPCPKSPPEYPDLYGKRRETAKIQMLEREISFLEEELKSVEGLQPASRYCKEVTDFVMAKSDPLIPTSRKNRKSCRFWKWLCGIPCFNLSWICCCCYSGCCPANAARWTAVHASATHVIAVHVNVARATAAHVKIAAACAIAARVNAAAYATAIRANAAAYATAVHVQAATQSRNGNVSAAHAIAVHVRAAAQSRNGNVSAAHATAVHVQAAAQSRNDCLCCKCKCSPKCPKVTLCCNCTKTCCNPCCLLF
ncbi:hypothetical protein HRI_005242400 [Hibiscus trionum]|uniref:G protein gamma domain-containing protein n=1 Tax=Hibiscus trionum TaxID=183268 RepID=A0A9W7MVS1_HIBTR|nr:hypothetical protein HRI_005242400 [Hibiscus trionum]